MIKASQKAISDGLQACRAAARTQLIKRAEGQELPFEQGFANLAHAVLSSKAPQLLDHQLGFQLLDKSEDNQSAVGVFAFDLSKQLAYGPVIFQGGKLKGTELLYLKDADLFLPMQEPWVNYLLRKRPTNIGDQISRSSAQRGSAKPDIMSIRQTPSKYAAEHWHDDGLAGLAAAATRGTPLPLRVPDLVKESADAAKTLLKMAESYQPFADALVACYGKQLLETALATAKTAGTLLDCEPVTSRCSLLDVTDATVRRPAVAVITKSAGMGLTSEEKTRVLVDGYIVRDSRTDDQVSRLYAVAPDLSRITAKTAAAPALPVPAQMPTLSVQTPTESGVYAIAVRPGGLAECVVLSHPHGRCGRVQKSLVIRRDNNKQWIMQDPKDMLALLRDDGDGIRGWFDKLPSVTPAVGGLYAYVSRKGDATAPFKVDSTQPASDDGEKCYSVWFRGGYAAYDSNAGRQWSGAMTYDTLKQPDVSAISVGWYPGAHVDVRDAMMYIPKDWKAIELKAPKKDDYPCCAPVSDEQSDPPPLCPGSHADLKLDIFRSTSKLAIDAAGHEILVNGKPMSATDAMAALVCAHGLRHAVAKQAILDAQVAHGKRAAMPSYRIKYAEPYPLQGGPTAPPIDDSQFMTTDPLFGTGMPAIAGPPRGMPIPGMESQPREPMSLEAKPGMPNPQDIMQAAQSGHREVFDTAILSSLVDSSRRESLVDRYLDDVLRGLDRIGRIMFAFWTHPDLFEEEFGAQDIVEIEDGLRNAFDATGKIVLKLKQRAADPTMHGQVEPEIGTFD